MTSMRRLSVLLVPVALLAAACGGGDGTPAPEALPTTTKQFVQQVWDGWSAKDQAATCHDYKVNPERTVTHLFPDSSGIPESDVKDLLNRSCK
jgi:ABC-type glycerol-3-phosphate transport system substrate-binding protein